MEKILSHAWLGQWMLPVGTRWQPSPAYSHQGHDRHLSGLGRGGWGGGPPAWVSGPNWPWWHKSERVPCQHREVLQSVSPGSMHPAGRCRTQANACLLPDLTCPRRRSARAAGQQPGCCTHIAYPLEEGQPLGTELSLLRSVAVSPPHGTGQLCLWAPMGCTSAVLALLHLPSARGSQDKVGSSPAAPGLERTQGDTTPDTWLPPRPSFRAFLRKKEQHRKEGNKSAQQWGMIGWLFSALVGSRDTLGSAITSPRWGC